MFGINNIDIEVFRKGSGEHRAVRGHFSVFDFRGRGLPTIPVSSAYEVA
jgi:hypothetical protein